MKMKEATRDAYGRTLVELGRVNKDIVVLDADLSKSTKTNMFAKEFPDRFFDLGIAEANMIGLAAGFATCGKIPFASTFAVFAPGRSFDQIRMCIGYSDLNVKIAVTHSGITVGEDGASHQSLEDIALARVIPNMTVLVPADGVETELAVRAAAEYIGPVFIRLGRSEVPIIFDQNYRFDWKKITILRQGRDVSIFATGIMVAEALKAAELLSREGVEAQVIDVHTIKPLDTEGVVKAARETGAVVTAEEHSIIGGLGGAIAEVLMENYPIPMSRVGIRDIFGESGSLGELLAKYGLTAQDIVRAAKEVVGRKRDWR